MSPYDDKSCIHRSSESIPIKSSVNTLEKLDTTFLTTSFRSLNLNRTRCSPSPKYGSNTSLGSNSCPDDSRYVNKESENEETRIESGR